VISGLTVTPSVQGLKEDLTVTASISDPDSAVASFEMIQEGDGPVKKLFSEKPAQRSVQVSKTFSVTKAGEYKVRLAASDEASKTEATASFRILAAEKPKIRFGKFPSKMTVNEKIKTAVVCGNAGKIDGTFAGVINWGDGTEDNFKTEPRRKTETASAVLEFPVEHVYAGEGVFTVTASLSATVEKTVLAADTITKQIPVTVIPMTVSLKQVAPSSRARQQSFKIQAKEGSFAVADWTLDFGDGRSETGQGAVDKTVTHTYASTGDRMVAFRVTDQGGEVIEKTDSVSIAEQGTTLPNLPENTGPSGASGNGPQLQEVSSSTSSNAKRTATVKKTSATKKTTVTSAKRGTAENPAAKGETGVINASLGPLQPPKKILAGRTNTFSVEITNLSGEPLKGFPVSFDCGDGNTETKSYRVPANDTKTVKFSCRPKKEGLLTVAATIAAENDSEASDNRVSLDVTVIPVS